MRECRNEEGNWKTKKKKKRIRRHPLHFVVHSRIVQVEIRNVRDKRRKKKDIYYIVKCTIHMHIRMYVIVFKDNCEQNEKYNKDKL